MSTVIVVAGTGSVIAVKKEMADKAPWEFVREIRQDTERNAREIRRAQDGLARLRERQGQIQSLVERVQDGNGWDDLNMEWALAEAEYLLVTAVYALELARDVGGAIAALEAAKLRLDGLRAPNLEPVRRQAAADLARLKKSARGFDGRAAARELLALSLQVADLPLRSAPIAPSASEPTAASAGEPAWKRLLRSLGDTFKEVLTVRRRGTASLSPDPADDARLLLSLRLEAARLAVLTRDADGYRSSLRAALALLHAHFNTEDGAVGGILDALTRLEAVPLHEDFPRVDSSLESLRAYRKNTVTARDLDETWR